MEPALPPLHPQVPALLEHLRLRTIDAFKWNVLACTDIDDPGREPKWIIKFGSDPRKAESVAYEVRILREVLPSLDQSEFERLMLPEYVDDGVFENLRWVRIKFIAGMHLIYNWSELTYKPEILGGKKADVRTAAYAVDVLRDLRSVDLSSLPDFVRRFNFDRWVADFQLKSETLVAKGDMERSTVDKALALFLSRTARRYEGSMFTNGDFYPRNFILLPEGKIAVVDWVGGVDPWEFVAMYAWLLMWGNPVWQLAYIREIKKHFPIDIEEMRVGLLIKSFEQAYRWKDTPEESIGFARTQMLAYFHQCLELEFVQAIFDEAGTTG